MTETKQKAIEMIEATSDDDILRVFDELQRILNAQMKKKANKQEKSNKIIAFEEMERMKLRSLDYIGKESDIKSIYADAIKEKYGNIG